MERAAIAPSAKHGTDEQAAQRASKPNLRFEL